MNSLTFSKKDLYPGLSGFETSTAVTPDTDDQTALNEDTNLADEATPTARKKNILIALGVLVALVVFFGGGK